MEEAGFLCCFTLAPRSILCSVLRPRGQTCQNALHQLSCSLVSSCTESWERQWKIRRWEEKRVGVTIFSAAPCLVASLAEAVFLPRDNSCWGAPTLPAAALARLWSPVPLFILSGHEVEWLCSPLLLPGSPLALRPPLWVPIALTAL